MNAPEGEPDVLVEVVRGARDDVVILRVSGPLTIRNFFEFQNLARQKTARVLIVDLSGVPYIDSAALGSLIGIHVSCEKDGRKYALAGVSDRIRKMFEVSHVDQFLITYPSATEAELALA